jgi:hypothetical protein
MRSAELFIVSALATVTMCKPTADLIAVFNFDRKTDRLSAVILRPREQRDNTRWAREQRLKLKATYGPLKEEQWFGIPTWKWKWQDIANVSYISKAWLEAMEADE